eukprot:2586885-Rhodomonas_salina.1
MSSAATQECKQKECKLWLSTPGELIQSDVVTALVNHFSAHSAFISASARPSVLVRPRVVAGG